MNSVRRRNTLRLAGYDYASEGVYFVTICVKGYKSRLGRIKHGKVRLNNVGYVVEREWQRTPAIRSNVCLDEYVIMPNHIHGIVIIERRGVLQYAPANEGGLRSPSQTLGAIVRGFKAASTRSVNDMHQTHRKKLWQRNYYERIIRNSSQLRGYQKYIRDNPMSWNLDRNNPIGM